MALQAQAPADTPPEIRVRIEQIAGATIYLDLGTNHGLAVGDTLPVLPDEGPPRLGSVWVRLANATRAVLEFAGDPFPLERGQIVRLQLQRVPTVAAPDPELGASGRDDAEVAPSDVVVPEPVEDDPVVAVERVQPVTGRWGLDLAGSHSVTDLGGGIGDQSVSRVFASPALRFDLFAPSSVGGFDLRLRTRATYRYGSSPGFNSELVPRFYEVSLFRQFDAVPLQLTMGRFHSPGESFSGYWDGLGARFGGSGFGLGALVGLQPDRWNQLPNSDMPKATVYADFEHRSEGVRWRGDVSAHSVWPPTSAGAHLFFGIGHRLTSGNFRLAQDLQVDRDSWNGGYRLSRFTTQATVRMAPGVHLRAGVSRRSTFLLWVDDPTELFAPQRDRVNVGLTTRSGRNSASVDVSLNRDVAGEVSRSVSGTLVGGSLWRDIGTMASFSYWDSALGTSWSVAPALRWAWGDVRGRTGYRFYTSNFARRTQTTHSPDISLSMRLPNRLRASLRVQGRFGPAVTSEFVQFSLSRVF
jgi:hypothetical protein